MAVGDEILSQWPLLLFLCIAFTLATIAVSGLSTQFLIRKQEYRENLALRAARHAQRRRRDSDKGANP